MQISALITAIMLIFALCGCQAQQGEVVATPDNTIEEAAPSHVIVTPEAIIYPEASEAVTSDSVSVLIYFGDDNCEHILSEEAEIPELSPQAILEKLREKGVFSQTITVNSFTVDNNNIIQLDLGAEFSDMIRAMGTSGEYIMIGSLVNSFLDAFDADGLSLTVDGQTLETGHNVYDFILSYHE